MKDGEGGLAKVEIGADGRGGGNHTISKRNPFLEEILRFSLRLNCLGENQIILLKSKCCNSVKLRENLYEYVYAPSDHKILQKTLCKIHTYMVFRLQNNIPI